MLIAAIACGVRMPSLILQSLSDDLPGRPGGIIGALIVIAMSTAGCLRPSFINGRTLVFWHVGIMVAISLILSPLGTTSADSLGVYRAPLLAWSFALGLFCVNVKVLACSFGVLSLCVVWSHAVALDPPKGYNLQDTVLTEFMVYLIRILVFSCLESSLYRGAQQEIQAKMGTCHRSAVSSLLGMVCDAVVEADSDLRLKRHEVSLSSLLMLAAGRSLLGTSITAVISPEQNSQESFQEAIDKNVQGDDGTPIPGLFRSRLRDSVGNSIRVTVYHVPYHSVSGRVHHLIGLAEDEEGRDRRAAATPQQPPEGELSDDIRQRLAAGARGMSPAHSQQSSRSSRSTGSHVPGGHTLTVDVLAAPGLPVDGATENFRSTFGCEHQGARFATVLGGDGGRLLAWIHERAAMRPIGAASAPRVESFGQVSMVAFDGRTSLGKRSLKVCFPAQPPEEGKEHCVSIRISRPSRAAAGAMGRGTASAGAPQELGFVASGSTARAPMVTL